MDIVDQLPADFIVFERLDLKQISNDIEIRDSGIQIFGKSPINFSRYPEFNRVSYIFHKIVKQMKILDEVSLSTKYQSGQYILLISKNKEMSIVCLGVFLPKQIEFDDKGEWKGKDYVSDYEYKKSQEINLIQTNLQKFILNEELPSSEAEDFFKESTLVSSLKDLIELSRIELKDESDSLLVNSKAISSVEKVLNNSVFNTHQDCYEASIVRCDDQQAILELNDNNLESCRIEIPLIVNGIDFSAQLWIARKYGRSVTYYPSENCALTVGFGTDKSVRVNPKHLEFSFSTEEAIEYFKAKLFQERVSDQLPLHMA